ncbi:MAG TPA: GNAT family N-acetyltransferase, partial [Verrucomicrobiae bacterium]|nr:GNAT family N-acetyltransferase [Verrucomicrobiae bacterium]
MNLIRCDISYLEPIRGILNEAITSSTAIYDYQPRTSAMMEGWFEAKRKDNFPVLGLVDEHGTLAGFGSYGTFRAWPAYKYSVEHSIYIAAGSRGRGLGTILLKAILEAAREQQY